MFKNILTLLSKLPICAIAFYGGTMLGGMFISWLIAAAVRESESLNETNLPPNDFQEINPTSNQRNERCAHGYPILNSR